MEIGINNDLLVTGIWELVLALLIGLLVLYVSYSCFYRFVYLKHDIQKDNTAYAILAASVIFSVGYIFAGVSDPLLMTIKYLRKVDAENFVMSCISYSTVFVVGALIISGLINVVSILLFTFMTRKVDEFDEIKQGNVAVSIITAAIIVSITLIVRENMVLLFDAFIPHPEMGARV